MILFLSSAFSSCARISAAVALSCCSLMMRLLRRVAECRDGDTGTKQKRKIRNNTQLMLQQPTRLLARATKTTLFLYAEQREGKYNTPLLLLALHFFDEARELSSARSGGGSAPPFPPPKAAQYEIGT